MKKGFTLIELLVSITILLLLLSGALASFVSFSDRRAVSRGVEEIKSAIAVLQTANQVGDLGGCTELSGYRLQTATTENGTQLVTQAVCLAGTAEAADITELDSVTVSPALDMTFYPLGKGIAFVSGETTETITVSNEGNIYEFVVSRDGQVTEGAWQ